MTVCSLPLHQRGISIQFAATKVRRRERGNKREGERERYEREGGESGRGVGRGHRMAFIL